MRVLSAPSAPRGEQRLGFEDQFTAWISPRCALPQIASRNKNTDQLGRAKLKLQNGAKTDNTAKTPMKTFSEAV
jgi:hypothetical protein